MALPHSQPARQHHHNKAEMVEDIDLSCFIADFSAVAWRVKSINLTRNRGSREKEEERKRERERGESCSYPLIEQFIQSTNSIKYN